MAEHMSDDWNRVASTVHASIVHACRDLRNVAATNPEVSGPGEAAQETAYGLVWVTFSSVLRTLFIRF